MLLTVGKRGMHAVFSVTWSVGFSFSRMSPGAKSQTTCLVKAGILPFLGQPEPYFTCFSPVVVVVVVIAADVCRVVLGNR